jgi:hypothetical protein
MKMTSKNSSTLNNINHTITFWNCNGMMNPIKNLQINQYLNTHSPAILTMAETHYYPSTSDHSTNNKKSKNYNHNIPNYQFSSSDYSCSQPISSSRPSGGIGVYVRNDLSYQPLPKLNSITNKTHTSTQIYWIHICFPPSIQVIIGTVYIHPDASKRDLGKISSAITSALNDYSYPVSF